MKHLFYIFVAMMSFFALNMGATEASQVHNPSEKQVESTNLKAELDNVNARIDNMTANVDSCKTALADNESSKVDYDKALWFAVALCLVLLVFIIVFGRQISRMNRKLGTAMSKDDTVSNRKDASQQLLVKIKNLEVRLAAVEKRLVAAETQLRSQGQNANAGVATSTVINTEKNTGKSSDIFYMPAPAEYGEFDDALRTDTKKHDTVYKFQIQRDGTATFEVDCNDSQKYWITENRQKVIESVCDLVGSDGIIAVTQRKGIVEYSNGKWIVKKRAVVNFV